MKRKRFYKGIAASLALCMLIPSMAYAAADETEAAAGGSAVQIQTDTKTADVPEMNVQEQTDQPEISEQEVADAVLPEKPEQEPADTDVSEKSEQEPADAVLPEMKIEKMPSEEIAEFAEAYSERQKEKADANKISMNKAITDKAAMNKAAVQKSSEPDNDGSIIPENQWLQTASTRVWYFGDGLFYSLKNGRMDVLGFWIVGATAVQNGDIWTVEGGTEYEYEEYKNAFGNEPPLPEELDHLRPDDPNPNPNPGDGDDDKDDPDNPGTGDSDPDDPDNPGTDDPDPDDPDNPGTDDPDPDDPDTPGIDDPDPDEPDQPVPAAGEWVKYIEAGGMFYIFSGDLIYSHNTLEPVEYELEEANWIVGAKLKYCGDNVWDKMEGEGKTYLQMKEYLGHIPPIPPEFVDIYMNYYEGVPLPDDPDQDDDTDQDDDPNQNEPDDPDNPDQGQPDSDDVSGEDSEESGSEDPEQEDADTDSENRQPDGANDTETKKLERNENVEKTVDLLAEKLKEAGIQIAKDQLEKWADHFLEKYPPLNTAKNTLEKINAACELYKTGKQIAEDWAKVTEAQEKADQAGVRNEEVAPFAKKWTSEIAENVYDLLPTEWTDFFLITNDQTGKILGEKAGNWAAGFVNYVQKPAYQQRDILREFGNENPEMSYN